MTTLTLRRVKDDFVITGGRGRWSDALKFRRVRNLVAIEPKNEQPKRGREVVVLAL